MKKILILATLLVSTLITFSQVKSTLSTFELVETTGIFNSPPVSKFLQVQIDTEEVLKETENEEKIGLNLPFRFAKGIDVDYGLLNSGDWYKLDEGRVWKLKIKSEKAYSLSLIFSKLIIFGKTQLYIYNEQGTMISGPITTKSISLDGGFKSDIIKGDGLILELFEPKDEIGTSVLQISRIVHGFRDIFQPTNFGGSFGCQDDVSCNSNWATQSNGVAMIILSNMERICSGSLLNNNCQNFTPNILTAFHCVDIGNDIDEIDPCSDNEYGNGTLTNQEITNAENWVFRFQYKRPNCNSGSEPVNFYTFQEATFRAGWFNTDFALVEMNQNPINGDPNTNIRYLGWSRSNVAPTSGSFLGHPAGDVMKISTFGNAASNVTPINWLLCTYPYRTNVSPANTHWTTTLNDGALQGGSSGGPFFDQNGRVVGQLHGGVQGCAPTTSHAGRFDLSWTGGGTNATRLSNWLSNNPDVNQTNTISIPSISGPSLICFSGATFTLNNPPSVDSIIWTSGPYTNITSGQNSTSCTISSNGSGNSWIRVRLVTNCGNITLPQYPVWAGAPQSPSITASLKNWGSYYEMRFFATQIDDVTYQWKIDGDIQPFYGAFCSYVGSQCGGDPALIFRDYNVEVSVINNCDTTTTCRIFRYSCGYSPSISFIGFCGGGGYEEMMEENDISILVAPNPANDNVKVSIYKKYYRVGNALFENKNLNLLPTLNKTYRFRIISSSGLAVYSSKLTDNSITISTSGLINGAYIIEISDGIKAFNQQLMIKH